MHIFAYGRPSLYRKVHRAINHSQSLQSTVEEFRTLLSQLQDRTFVNDHKHEEAGFAVATLAREQGLLRATLINELALFRAGLAQDLQEQMGACQATLTLQVAFEI